MHFSNPQGAVEPLRFLLALRAKCPEFAKKDARGSFAQQDAEEYIPEAGTSPNQGSRVLIFSAILGKI